MTKKLYQSILILLGVLMFTAFIWLRFIRERLPKILPFNLSLLSFCILLCTCSIFMYIIISLFRDTKPVDPLLKQMMDGIYIPLKTLDHYIKHLSYTNNTYKYGINFLAYILGPLVIDSKLFYYIFVIMPRLVLLTALHIDVFWCNKLYYIYIILLIGILIFIGRYIIYSFKYAKENFIESFKHYVSISMSYDIAMQILKPDPDEEDEDFDDLPTLVVPLPGFIDFQTNVFIMQDTYYDYMAFFRNRIDSYYEENNISVLRVFTHEEVGTRVRNILKISLILAHYEIINDDKQIKHLKKWIYINYLLCWSYILIVSFPSLFYASYWELWIILNIQDNIEPFSLITTDDND
jgi:hypothetical protein